MRSGKSLIGLSVIGQNDGTRLGPVRDLIFDVEAGQVLALVLSEQDLFGLIDASIVPWRDVRNVGKDAILVDSVGAKISLKSDERIHQLAQKQRDTILSGTQILTADGKSLGTLADMMIDETTGRVAGYEVSGGFVSDTLHGKKFLPASTPLSLGHDAAIVPPDAAQDLTKL